MGKRLVAAARAGVISLLYIDIGDVVRQEQFFVGMNFLPILPLQILFGDEVGGSQHTNDKAAGAGERVKNMHILGGETGNFEFLAKQPVGALVDEIHHLHRGVDNAGLLGLAF